MCFSKPLSVIFNIIIKTNQFSEVSKVSNFKKGNKNDIKNYRHIAIICNFSRYLKYVSTKFTITIFLVTLSQTWDIKLNIYVKFVTETEVRHNIDFTKVFNCISHTLLLSKIKSVSLFSSLLSLLEFKSENRKHYVQDYGQKSHLFEHVSGVPQESSIRPLFFIIFIYIFYIILYYIYNFLYFTVFENNYYYIKMCSVPPFLYVLYIQLCYLSTFYRFVPFTINKELKYQ